MSAFKPGKYVILFEPFGVGGMYATRQEGRDLPVTLGAQVPGLVERQSWTVTAGDTEGQWLITSGGDISVGTDILSLGSWLDIPEVPAGPVVALHYPFMSKEDGIGPVVQFQYWIVTPVDVPGVDNTFTVQPVTSADGMNYYVGVKDDELYIKAFPILDDTPKPYWQFNLISEPNDEAA